MRQKMSAEGKGRIIKHGKGTGDVADEDIEIRAREIAAIHGRTREQISWEDRAEARAELQGDSIPDISTDDHDGGATVTRDPSEPAGVTGHRVSNMEPEDESSGPERLATEGVEEAQHDQMLAAQRKERHGKRD
jgi:hypothetical protein